jgi:ABC-2 type transport system permease protein
MRPALHAEWTKLRTAASTAWLLVALVALTVAVTALIAASGPGSDPAKTSLSGIYLGQAVVAVLAVMTMSGEYGTGMIRLTFAATPRRSLVLAAKAALLAALVLVAGAVAMAGSAVAGRLLLPSGGWSLTDGPVLRAVGGSVLYLVLVAVLGVGVAAVVREPAVAIGTVLGLLYLFPVLAATVPDHDLQRHLKQAGPMSAGLAVQATRDLHRLPIGPWPGLGVLAAWSLGILLVGYLLLRLRDA